MLAAAVVASGIGLSTAHASDLPVTYSVQDQPLKTGATAGTPLTFTLYSDAACTQQVYQATVPVQNVTLISKLKLLTPKGATKVPTTDELQATLTGVTAGGNLYLTVTGTGVTAEGATCQAQDASDQGTLPTLHDLTVQTGNAQVVLWNDPSNTVTSGGLLMPHDRQAAAAFQALPDGTLELCDVDVMKDGAGVFQEIWGVMAFGVRNCRTAPTCSNGVCGGACPPCSDGQSCSAPSDCASGHCRVAGPPACYSGTPSFCVPAHCFDGVKDNGESDIDCGGGCFIGCASGQTCNYSTCNCVSGVCNADVCQ
jgi:hypothetical protein